MKNTIKIFLLILAGGLFVISCEKDIPDNTYTGSVMAEFVSPSYLFEVLKEPVANVTDTIKVQYVGPQQSSDKKVTVEVVDPDSVGVTNPALENVHYILPSKTVTIPKGKSVGFLLITVKHSGFMIEEEAVLTLELKEGDGVKINGERNICSITLHKKNFCPYVRSDLYGTWPAVESALGGTWSTTIIISEGEGDTILVDGLWYDAPVLYWGETMLDKIPTKFLFDTTDAAAPTINIPYPQYLNTSLDPNGVDVYYYGIMQSPGVDGTYDYCDQQVILYYDEIYDANPNNFMDMVTTTIDVSGKKQGVNIPSIRALDKKFK